MSNHDDMRAYLEQYRQSGGDLSEVILTCQALTSTGKTPLGLNQWVLTDKPRMEEFNQDNRIIDEQLRKKANIGTPQTYPINFMDTYEGPDSYMYKDSENRVHLYINATCKDAYIDHSDNVLTLPEGFRPYGNVFIVGSIVLINEDNKRVPGFMAYHSGNKSLSILKMYGLFDDRFKHISGGFCFLAQ